jgi:hypothetical protein
MPAQFVHVHAAAATLRDESPLMAATIGMIAGSLLNAQPEAQPE